MTLPLRSRHGHVAHFSEDQKWLARSAAGYLWESLERGGGAVVFATPERREAILEQLEVLGAHPGEAISAGRLIMRDARETLSRVLVDGYPDTDRFDRTIRSVLRELRITGHARVYGEMVALLWRRGRHSAAIRLEHLWNRLVQLHGLGVYCAYPIDVFAAEFQFPTVEAVLCEHTQLLPTGNDGDLQKALDRAIADCMGNQNGRIQRQMRAAYHPACAVLPRGEANILWIRRNLPTHAAEILLRARRLFEESKPAAISQTASTALS